jgi:uncharacterized NAD(P)/FAD-binding protein YdhS
MKRIGIIGGGFAGTMTVVQLIRKLREPCEIIVINEKETLNKGIAFSSYSEKQLLNVQTGKMSAYPDKPDHFLHWVASRQEFKEMDASLLSNSFLPRRLYGDYLSSIWENSLSAAVEKKIIISVIDSFVINLEINEDTVLLDLDNRDKLTVDHCVIATGNHMPRNPEISNKDFYLNKNYFQNPWGIESVKNISNDLPVLIIGNGLTMVDSVLGILEHGFKGEIYSISPNGFNILPHTDHDLNYLKLSEELTENISLFDLVKLVNKHLKKTKKYNIPAEVIIDSLRPHTQRIWKNFSIHDKAVFMSRLRHLWGVARHRVPANIYNKIQQLRMDGRLHIHSGKILDFYEFGNYIEAEYFDKKNNRIKKLKVCRIINCTGPETNLMNLNKSFLKNCLLNGILTQDALQLGIKTDTETFQVIDLSGKLHPNLFTLGSTLKGELWESTAVSELRIQAEKLAEKLIDQLTN